MNKALVIVESPAKAKTINRYLGKDYIVQSSVGHIRDLPISDSVSQNSAHDRKKEKITQNAQNLLIKQLGIDPYHGWKAQYTILPGKEKLTADLITLAKKANHIYLATDFDREGEAIAWHLREVIGGDDNRFSRVVFNEITNSAITRAFKNPKKLNINWVNAQQTRRFIDRIFGYMISPLLWKKIARGLSAGRVQSVAVRLVVEREREIKTFTPEEYWKIHADLQTAQACSLTMQVTHQKEKLFKPVSKKQIQLALDKFKHVEYIVKERCDKVINSKPGAPFTTSTLQQAASDYLGYSIKKTMILAQQLYESGYITYMRTDSTNLSQNALTMARDYISLSFGNLYLPKQPNKYISKNNTQEAHEAIRPSNIDTLAEQLQSIETDAQKLYQLIWRQFISSQMTPAQYNSSTLTVTASEFQLRAYGRTLHFDGWTRAMPDLRKGNKDQILPAVKVGDILTLNKLLPSQHFTKPPIRYREASLVKELEKRGIGRPSTYVPVISTIQERGYIYVKNRRFYAEKIGEIVTNRLEENFRELVDYDFTAKMETILDQIAEKNQDWKNVLDAFFDKFIKQLEHAKKDPEDGGMKTNQIVITSINCSVCGRKMGIRTASTGVFLSCSGYSLSRQERCKNTVNLIPEMKALDLLEKASVETKKLHVRSCCKKCGSVMDSYIMDNQNRLHVCSNSPQCNGYSIEQAKFQIQGYNNLTVMCEKCGADMNLKSGRFGKYMLCSKDDCKNTRKVFRNGDIAPPKADPVPLPELSCEKTNAYFMLREGRSGIFLSANTFPKSRECRAPLVKELARFYDRLPDKFRYLASAPVSDDKGNSTLVRFNRKTKQQYISAEKNGKPTGWTAFYIDGRWKVTKKK